MVKQSIRLQLRDRIKSIPHEDLHRKSIAACEKLCETEEFARASVVMLFLSLPDEVDTSHAILRVFQQDKTVVTPSILWHQRHLIPVTMSSLECELVHDRHGLRHPADGQPVPADQIDLVVVPGLGFDRQGNRLGRGGGFYDRFLGRDDFQGVSCGLAFEEQVIDEIPVSEHDISLDLLVTDRQVRRFYSKEEQKF
jgi:5-formyltetrahydrofolate cyclo-ligase